MPSSCGDMLWVLKEWCPCPWWLQESSNTELDISREEVCSSNEHSEDQGRCTPRRSQSCGNDADPLRWGKNTDDCWLPKEVSSPKEAHSRIAPEQTTISQSRQRTSTNSPQQSASENGVHPISSWSNKGFVCKADRSPSHASTASTQQGNYGIAWNPDVEITPPMVVHLEPRPQTPDPALDRFLIGGYKTPQIVGKANSTKRYNPTQRIPRHNTPFEERMENEMQEEATARSAMRRRRSRIES